VNPGIGNALSAIGRIQHRMSEIQARMGQVGPQAPFAQRLAQAGGTVVSAVSAPPGGAPGGPPTPAGLAGALGPNGAAPLGDLHPKAAAGGTAAFKDLIAGAAQRHEVDPNLVRAVMAAESGGNPEARSPVGAIGLMQLMPGTAKDLGVADPADPAQNVEGGAKYLAALTKRFGLEHGVAAYNAGPGAVERYGGVPPYKETRAYVDRVMRLYGAFSEE
jgi:soluble lytic murein transglycosylase-like protein